MPKLTPDELSSLLESVQLTNARLTIAWDMIKSGAPGAEGEAELALLNAATLHDLLAVYRQAGKL